MLVIKRNNLTEPFDWEKIRKAVSAAFTATGTPFTDEIFEDIKDEIYLDSDTITVENLQDQIEKALYECGYFSIMKAYILYREDRNNVRKYVAEKEDFINKYKKSSNTANATVDDNSNVGGKNIGVLNAEIHKADNIKVSRGMMTKKLASLFPDLNPKQYMHDLNSHIIYKHDESSFSGPIAPYCCSITMYPFLIGGIKGIGGLSASPKNLDSFCGMYINLIFATSAMFAGAVATSEFLLYFDYFARKQWGNNYYEKPDAGTTSEYVERKMTIRKEIHQYFQQVVYSINQPAAARGMQSAFVNFSYFDHAFFEGMFGDFYFPDGSQPIWESLNWLQKEFMQWFNAERLKTMITFPVKFSGFIQ